MFKNRTELSKEDFKTILKIGDQIGVSEKDIRRWAVKYGYIISPKREKTNDSRNNSRTNIRNCYTN